jgi:acetyl esterase/lipase
MKVLLVLITILFCSQTMLQAQSASPEMPLYPGPIPNTKAVGNLEHVEFRNDGTRFIYDTSLPTLTAYLPKTPNGMAVIICPGGGYSGTAIDKEGILVAQTLNEDGITAFVLKYRIPQDTAQIDKSLAPLQDAQQAIRSVRRGASKHGVNPHKIGIMGFSAGGHLAASAATRFYTFAQPNVTDTTSVRPDFVVLIYPVINLGQELMHEGSRINLLGQSPSEAQIQLFSTDLHVRADTPPAFLVHTGDDAAVPVGNSIAFYQACLKYNVPAEMHLYPAGGHGFGMFNTTTKDRWIERLRNWLKGML